MIIDQFSPGVSSPDTCAICNRPPSEGVKIQNSGFDKLTIVCPQCGQYELDGPEAIAGCYHWSAELRPPLSCAARQASETGQPIRITVANVQALAEPHRQTRVIDNLDLLLRAVAKRAPRPEMLAELDTRVDFTLLDCFRREELRWYIQKLMEQKLLDGGNPYDDKVPLLLTVDGWCRVQPLPQRGGIPGRCFVAMWFSEETRPV